LSMRTRAVSTEEHLRFQMDHAVARDAVHREMDLAMLGRGLAARRRQCVALRSAVTGGRGEYLKRPDLGRRLGADSADAMRECEAAEVVIVLADGLSALAVERHGLALLDALLPLMGEWSVGVICLATQARVAIGDEIGAALRAKMSVVLIGERPGLSAADSLGVYLTWEPRVGRMDAERNCVSNVRTGGLGYTEAAERIAGLMRGARVLGASGVGLKDAGATAGQRADAYSLQEGQKEAR
jgi:ethanolamine ammonia-lyase small subunit